MDGVGLASLRVQIVLLAAKLVGIHVQRLSVLSWPSGAQLSASYKRVLQPKVVGLCKKVGMSLCEIHMTVGKYMGWLSGWLGSLVCLQLLPK